MGSHSAVGAGAVVTVDVGPGSVVVGNPAKALVDTQEGPEAQ